MDSHEKSGKTCYRSPLLLTIVAILLLCSFLMGIYELQYSSMIIGLDYIDVSQKAEEYRLENEGEAKVPFLWKYWSIPLRYVKIQGAFKYAQFAIKPFVWNVNDNSTLVCLATQTSLNGIHHIVETASYWRGKMVVSLYVPGLEFARAKILLWILVECKKLISSDVLFYFTWPFETPPIDDPELWNLIPYNKCDDIFSIITSLEVKQNISMYPQNSMRNIARGKCDSQYVIVIDSDMVPTPDLSTALQPELQKQNSCEKCAFVVPGYEFDYSVPILPNTKSELVEMVRQKVAQPFHWQSWRPNQASHDPKRWEEMQNSTEVKIAYPILRYEYKYEPIYVIKKSAPDWDDRFIGFGYNRNSQIIQMIFEKYRFFLLDNVFLRHRGMKKNLDPPNRVAERNGNYLVLIEFSKELLRKYNRTDIVERMEEADGNKQEAVLQTFLEQYYYNYTYVDT